MPRDRVGVDVGGTFTDVVTATDGRLAVTKVPSTPDAPEGGVLDGLERASGAGGVAPSAIDALVHGTTVATNAMLEGTWADAALVTTAGFRDVLEIGRQDRPDLYDLTATKAEPIVPRDRRFEVPERLDERGRVEEPLDEDAVRAVAAEIAAIGSERRSTTGDDSDGDVTDGDGTGDDSDGIGGDDSDGDGTDVDAVAVCLLFAFENDAHERRVADCLAERLDVPVTISSDVLPELREYERTLATAANAALLPVMETYVRRLTDGLAARDCDAPLAVSTSAGGLVDASHVRRRPVETLLSGPAAGVQGAAHVADLAGVADVLTMDMGGTSCDVSVVTGGEPTVTTERTVGDYEIAVPAVDVHTVGSGGGSIAWLDDGGALRVGPRSAGADPGPVCYGRGGTEPTITDAHLLLGRLDPDALLVDDLDADRDAVEAAVAERIAEPTDRSVEAAARGILEVANANVERALRVVSVERGHDPREFGLVAYGGAGPLHATALAERLDIPRVLVPRTAGALSALGLLATDRLQAVSRSMVRPLSEIDAATLLDALEALEAEGRDRMRDDGGEPAATLGDGPAATLGVERTVELRYVGQSSELSVPVGGEQWPDVTDDGGDAVDGLDGTDDLTATLAERFHERHAERYGHAAPDEPVELVTARVRVRSPVEPPSLEPPASAGQSAADAIREERPVAFGDEWYDARIYDRERLPADAAFDGPAVVEGPESTVVVRPGQSATVDEHGTIVVEVAP